MNRRSNVRRTILFSDIVRQGEVQSVNWVGITVATRTVSITTVIKTLVLATVPLANVTAKLHLILA